MNAPTVVTLKFPQFGKELASDPSEDLPDFIKEPATDPSETFDLDSPDNLPTVILPRRRTIASFLPRYWTKANFTSITGAALVGGALMQVYYSDLAPMDPWSAPAVFTFLAVMLLSILSLFI